MYILSRIDGDSREKMSLAQQMLEQAGYTSHELNQISDSYKKYCGGSEMMSGEQFTALFTQLGCPEKLCHRCFRAMSSTYHQNQISLEELMVGLCALDPDSPHAAIIAQFRCHFIFKYYNSSQSGTLNFDELREMISDVCAAKRLTLDLHKATNDHWQMFGGEGEVTLEKFLAAVNQLQFRGTSYLFRLPQPPVVRKSSVASPPADGGQSKKDSRDDDRVDRRLESSGSSGEICHTRAKQEDKKRERMTRKDSLIDMDSTFEEEEQESGEDGQDENEYTVETRVVKIIRKRVRRARTPTLPEFMKSTSEVFEFVDDDSAQSPTAIKQTVDTSALDEMPALGTLVNFEKKNGEKIDILAKIGNNYKHLCIHLLIDNDGAILATISSNCRGIASDILLAIFRRWLQGQGKEPITWKTLIEVLEVIRLKVLAQEIEEGLLHKCNRGRD